MYIQCDGLHRLRSGVAGSLVSVGLTVTPPFLKSGSTGRDFPQGHVQQKPEDVLAKHRMCYPERKSLHTLLNTSRHHIQHIRACVHLGPPYLPSYPLQHREQRRAAWRRVGRPGVPSQRRREKAKRDLETRAPLAHQFTQTRGSVLSPRSPQHPVPLVVRRGASPHPLRAAPLLPQLSLSTPCVPGEEREPV